MGATVAERETSPRIAAAERSRRRPAGPIGADARLGCLLELTRRGTVPVQLPGGEMRAASVIVPEITAPD